MRLNPHSLDDPPFSHSSSDDASDSPNILSLINNIITLFHLILFHSLYIPDYYYIIFIIVVFDNFVRGKRDHVPVLFDKPLNDIDCSSSPSSKLPSSSPSSSPSLSRLIPRTLSSSFSPASPLYRGSDNNPTPITKSFSFTGDDLLSSSHDFLDQFRFNKSSSTSGMFLSLILFLLLLVF